MVKDKRLATIKYYEDRKIALAAEEAYIHAAMEPSREVRDSQKKGTPAFQ